MFKSGVEPHESLINSLKTTSTPFCELLKFRVGLRTNQNTWHFLRVDLKMSMKSFLSFALVDCFAVWELLAIQ